ncbi:MAG TPA: protease, partial [Gammaproteobacteria bacterium]|nr:protease [Gammaproteobacteria bacterium]
ADVNLDYHDWRNWVVDSVNGEPIRDFAHFSNMVKNTDAENIVFENTNGYQMIINHADAVDSAQQILGQYRIPAAYSKELFPE